jgi:hypothetical protein
MARVGYSGARGEGGTDLWKNIKLKISCQIHIKSLKCDTAKTSHHNLLPSSCGDGTRFLTVCVFQVSITFLTVLYISGVRPACHLPHPDLFLSCCLPLHRLNVSIFLFRFVFDSCAMHLQIFLTSFEANQAKSNVILLLFCNQILICILNLLFLLFFALILAKLYNFFHFFSIWIITFKGIDIQ